MIVEDKCLIRTTLDIKDLTLEQAFDKLEGIVSQYYGLQLERVTGEVCISISKVHRITYTLVYKGESEILQTDLFDYLYAIIQKIALEISPLSCYLCRQNKIELDSKLNRWLNSSIMARRNNSLDRGKLFHMNLE